MSTLTLLGRSLRYYWRTHLGVLLGTALGSLVLLGALLVGDSVKATLLRQAMERVGKVQSALIGGDHFFRAQLGAETGSVPILLLRGSLTGESAGARANNVQVVGVPPDFWALAPGAGWKRNPDPCGFSLLAGAAWLGTPAQSEGIGVD